MAFDATEVRLRFPALQRTLRKGRPVVYLDTAASAQKPQSVIDKEVEVYSQYYANAYRGVYEYGARVDDELEASRAKVQRLLNAESMDEIVFTPGTTFSINLVARAWGQRYLQLGDEVLVTDMEHHANLVPWQQIAAERGASLRHLPLTEDGRLDLDRLGEVLSRKTKLVAVTAMSNVLGTVNPLERIVHAARHFGARVLVDAAQSVAHLPTDVRALGVDFLAFSGHKLYGPSGVGVLYGRRELLESMDPFLGGGHMVARVERTRFEPAPIPAKFEAGTLPIAQAIALGAAVEFLDELGLDAIHRHEQELVRAAMARLSAIPGLRIVGPAADQRGAVVSFVIQGAAAEDLAQLLNLRGVFVRHGHHCAMPLHDWLGVPATVRASFGVYSTLAEIETLAAALEAALAKLGLSQQGPS